MKRAKTYIYKTYSYVIPTIIMIIYVCLVVFVKRNNLQVKLIHESLGFAELCKSISGFTSIVIGIYGFFVPIILGKQDDEFVKRFWNLIDKKIFISDIKKLVFSGISTILICSFLLVEDVLPEGIVIGSVCLLLWMVLFFSCSTYRFIGIFIGLIVGNWNKVDDEKVESMISEEDEENLRSRYE